MNTEVQHLKTLEFLNSFDADSQIKDNFIIDSGCGDGFATKEFIKRGAGFVESYDPNNSKYDREYQYRILWEDKCMSYNNAHIVWSHHVIEHVENPINYLKITRTMLLPEGELWLACPNTTNNSVWAFGHLSNFTLGNLIRCLQLANYATYGIKWWVTEGQIRIRIQREGSNCLPEPIALLAEKDKHFDLNNLPKRWDWK